jgi:hypothetical protein
LRRQTILGIEFASSKMESWLNVTLQRTSRDSSELASKLKWFLIVPGINSTSNRIKAISKCYLKEKWLMQYRFLMEYLKIQKIRTKQQLIKASKKRKSII